MTPRSDNAGRRVPSPNLPVSAFPDHSDPQRRSVKADGHKATAFWPFSGKSHETETVETEVSPHLLTPRAPRPSAIDDNPLDPPRPRLGLSTASRSRSQPALREAAVSTDRNRLWKQSSRSPAGNSPTAHGRSPPTYATNRPLLSPPSPAVLDAASPDKYGHGIDSPHRRLADSQQHLLPLGALSAHTGPRKLGPDRYSPGMNLPHQTLADSKQYLLPVGALGAHTVSRKAGHGKSHDRSDHGRPKTATTTTPSPDGPSHCP